MGRINDQSRYELDAIPSPDDFIPGSDADTPGLITKTYRIRDILALVDQVLPGDNLGDHTATQNLDLAGFDIDNLNAIQFTPTDTEPAGAAKGAVYYDDSENLLKFFDGTAWNAIGAGGGGAPAPVDSVFGRTGVIVAEVGDYSAFYAPLSHNHAWADITSGVPTTLSGYGITDAYTQTEVDNLLTGYLQPNAETVTGVWTFTGRPSFQSTGAPITVSSDTLVDNLNADLLDGLEASQFLRKDQDDTSVGTITALRFQSGVWRIAQEGSDLVFRYNGSDVVRFTATGDIQAEGDGEFFETL